MIRMRSRGAGYEAHKAPLDWFIGAIGPNTKRQDCLRWDFHPVGSCIAHARNRKLERNHQVAKFDLGG
jgi:hypothetical protein